MSGKGPIRIRDYMVTKKGLHDPQHTETLESKPPHMKQTSEASTKPTNIQNQSSTCPNSFILSSQFIFGSEHVLLFC